MSVYSISDKMLRGTKENSKSKSNTNNKSSLKRKTVAVGSTSTITNFFKNAPLKPIVCVEKRASDSRAFYVQALKDRVKSYNGETGKENVGTTVENENAYIANDQKKQTGIVCSATGDRNNLQSTDVLDSGTDDNDNVVDSNGKNAARLCDASCEFLRQKYKDLKKAHFQLCHKHCEISMKYEQLVETLDAVRKAKSSNDEVSDMPLSNDNVFTPNQIRIVESLPLEKKKDSTFILQCIEYAYKNNTSSLANKTLYGTLERKEFGEDGAVVVRPAKDPLTPEKVKRIEELFVKRVTKSKCLAAEFAERIKSRNINRLIASAIRNVSNKENPKKPQKNINLNL